MMPQISVSDDVGNGLNVLKVMPESAIKFGSYEVCSKSLTIDQTLSKERHLGL